MHFMLCNTFWINELELMLYTSIYKYDGAFRNSSINIYLYLASAKPKYTFIEWNSFQIRGVCFLLTWSSFLYILRSNATGRHPVIYDELWCTLKRDHYAVRIYRLLCNIDEDTNDRLFQYQLVCIWMRFNSSFCIQERCFIPKNQHAILNIL